MISVFFKILFVIFILPLKFNYFASFAYATAISAPTFALLYTNAILASKLFPSVSSTIFADRKSTRLNSSHVAISYAVFCLKKKIDNVVHDPYLTDRQK